MDGMDLMDQMDAMDGAVWTGAGAAPVHKVHRVHRERCRRQGLPPRQKKQPRAGVGAGLFGRAVQDTAPTGCGGGAAGGRARTVHFFFADFSSATAAWAAARRATGTRKGEHET